MKHIKTFVELITEKKKPKDTSYSKNIIFDQISSSVPIEIIKEIVFNWDFVYWKSPYGQSYYSARVGWGHKPDGSYRMSNHWNFTANNKPGIHCATSNSVENDTHWSIGIFDALTKTYKIILSIPNVVDREENKIEIKKLKKEFITNNKEQIEQYLGDNYKRIMPKRYIDISKKVNTFLTNNVDKFEIYVDYEKTSSNIKIGTSGLRYINQNGDQIILKRTNYKLADILVKIDGKEFFHKLPGKKVIDKIDISNKIKSLV